MSTRIRSAVALLWALNITIHAGAAPPSAPPHVPAATHNLLLEARVSGNLASYRKGLRGEPDHVIYDVARRAFVKPSAWHEYGVDFAADLGVVPESKPAYWMAEWAQPVRANFMVFSGAYENQPQPDTAWKIELRRDGVWQTHARGVGGWYDRGRYVWGGSETLPIEFDALRVSVFSKDNRTPIKSIHFRGEPGLSWIVAFLPPLDASLETPRRFVRAGQPVRLEGRTLKGRVTSWQWDFGDGTTAAGRTVTHRFPETGEYRVALTFSDGKHTATVYKKIRVHSPLQVELAPLNGPVLTGRSVTFTARTVVGTPTVYTWDFGDGRTARGATVQHAFARPGIYKVKVTAREGAVQDDCLALVRVHTPATLHVPQVLLDTDAKNEQDDQHYLGYALFSELDVLGINSTHHGGGQEPINYAEIQHVIALAQKSGLRPDRVPFVFRGANQRLEAPMGGDWRDTEPLITEASEAILAAARGASPGNPVWIVPVGPGTNPASAILQALREGLDLKGRIRIMWLGGADHGVIPEFNGGNDPWSIVVLARSGIEMWIMPASVGARVAIDKRTEGHLYADHPLGQYLKRIVPPGPKALFDPSCLSAIISLRLGLGWIKTTEFVTVGGPEVGYRWIHSDRPTSVRVIREIDQAAMKRDIFATMKGHPTRLLGAPWPSSTKAKSTP